MKLQNDLGEIRISSEVFTTITGAVATSCFGVNSGRGGWVARSFRKSML